MNKTTAAKLTAGQTYRDEYRQTHTVERVEAGQAGGRGVYVYVEGQGYPEFYLNESAVTLTEKPAPVAPVAAWKPAKPRARRELTCSAHYYDNNGRHRAAWYRDNDTLQAGIDRLIAKGYMIISWA